jgi:hypothetical protein
MRVIFALKGRPLPVRQRTPINRSVFAADYDSVYPLDRASEDLLHRKLLKHHTIP